jgi:RimJ/RimL family protein N-acetyltransferase
MQEANLLPRNAGHVVLRRLGIGDLTAFQAYRRDAQVGLYQGWSPMSQAEALAFIGEMAAAKLFEPGVWAQLAIARAEDNALVGDLGLCVAENLEHAEVGFTVCPAAQGQGYGSAAVAEAIRLLFEQTAVQRVIGITDARNTPSVRLLERVGMRRVESRETVFKGEPCTEWVYARRR